MVMIRYGNDSCNMQNNFLFLGTIRNKQDLIKLFKNIHVVKNTIQYSTHKQKRHDCYPGGHSNWRPPNT